MKTKPAAAKAPKESAKPSPYAVPALERGVQIVEILAEARRPLSLTEVAAKLGLASGMVYRLLRQLTEQQWLMQDANSQKYSLSLRLYSFALSSHPHALLIEAARQPLQELAAETGQSCHLTLLINDEIVVGASAPAPRPIRLTVDVGSRHSITDTTSGPLLIALLPPTEQARVRGKWTTAELKRIANQGYNESHHRNVHGVHDLAVPIHLPQGYAALAMSVLGADTKVGGNILDFLPAMQKTAKIIEQTLGLTTPATPQ